MLRKIIATICVLSLVLCSCAVVSAKEFITATVDNVDIDYVSGTVNLSGTAAKGSLMGVFLTPENDYYNFLYADNFTVTSDDGAWEKSFKLPYPLAEGEYTIAVSANGDVVSGYDRSFYITDKATALEFEGDLEAGNTYTVKSSAINITGENIERNFIAIIAVYDENGVLQAFNAGSQVSVLDAKDRGTDVTASVELPSDFTTGWFVKAFL